ncbi:MULTISPECIES: class I SAM-dependent methyltransferase [Prevotellaceae]|uniref:class I SAM-dependent methyltransferase n=1 Tax=Prevotellaceae TaxID=171552 RepID=UPI0005612785|nr:class I SAM-dependent methyltransferase [Prevotella phocaeensis]
MENRQSNSYQRMMGYYDDVLTGRKWWSRIYTRWIWNDDSNLLARKVLDFIPNDFRGRLLDVPVGTAIFTAEKYRRLKGAEVIGLDYSEEMIAIATLRKKTEQIANLSLVQGDVGELPYANESFDCVLSMNGFHAFPEKEKAFSETFRVLKPGGCFYVWGERRLADLFVKNVLERKGFFLPPYDTFAEAGSRLRNMYGDDVLTEKISSACLFRCVKPQKNQ